MVFLKSGDFGIFYFWDFWWRFWYDFSGEKRMVIFGGENGISQ